MDFVSIALFTILLYVRPQEIFGFLEALRPAFVVMAMGFVALLVRPGGLNPKTILRTPHDWLMAAYFLWIIFTNEAEYETWKKIYPFVGFYFISVQALTSVERIYQLLYVLLGCIMFIAIMALAQLIGIDPVGSAGVTEGSNGRLVFNTGLFNNANALGHSVIVAIPLTYFLMVWKREIFVKEVAIPMFGIALWCVYLTESKGSFISGFGAVLATLTFGRPKWIQAIILTLALTVGWGAMAALPRFGELQASKASKDEAIQGRVRAFVFGRWATDTLQYGVGYGNFVDAMARKEGEEAAIASHSSYNQISAELGKGGLFLFVGLMYVAMRTLVQAKTANVQEERIRRAMFCLVLGYGVSSWMIDFGFRALFFLMIAMVGAFHRMLQTRTGVVGAEQDLEQALQRESNPLHGMAAAGATGAQTYMAQMKQIRGAARRGMGTAMSAVAPIAPLSGSATIQASNAYAPAAIEPGIALPTGASSFMPWARLGWLDFVLMYALLRLALYIRVYAIEDLFAG